MKYPAIYKSVEGSEYLYQNKDSYYCYERQLWDSSEPHHDCHHSDKNITAEYLANTYGEVKSKEHAEFIVKLAEVNNFRLCNPEKTDKKWFCFDSNELYFFDDVEDASDLDEKQITIPLPPECEERKPKEVIANGKKHTLNLVTGFYDFGVIELGYATGSTLEKLQEADDYQVLSFVDECDEGKEDEWPKVGSSVEWGHASKGEVKSLSDGFAWIKMDNKDYTTVYISSLRKPKTPEQDLRDEVNDCINDFQCQYMEREDIDYDKSAEYILSRFDINKKPQ